MRHEHCIFGIHQLVQKPYLLDLQLMRHEHSILGGDQKCVEFFYVYSSSEGWMLHSCDR